MPFHLLLAAMDNQPVTALNIGTRILNYILWFVVAALMVRLIVNRFRKGP